MKNICTLIFLITLTSLEAQVSFTPNIISGDIGLFDDPVSVYVGDLDNDADNDFAIIEGSVFPDKVFWFENVGDENFTKHLVYDGMVIKQIEGIDFDNDGDIDLVTTEGALIWFENDGTGNFTEHLIPFEEGNMFAVESSKSELIDLDQDGDRDFLMPSTDFYNISPCDDNTLYWLENDGNLNFTAVSITCEEFDDANDLVASDYDDDGDIDFIATNGCNPITLSWYENNGNEQFSYHFIEQFETCNLGNLVKGDLDNDSYTDFIISNDGEIYWYENDGAGGFEKSILTTDALGTYTIVINDLDEDSDNDLVVALAEGTVWFENNGNQFFSKVIIGEYHGSGARSVIVKDIDNDGDKDVASCGGEGNRVTWYENYGDEDFHEHPIQDKSFGASDVYGADIDGDNDIDVLSASKYDNKISWIENFDNVIYSEHIVGKIDDAVAVFAIDMDNDGDMDILGAGEYVAWFENDGNNHFSQHIVSINTSSIETVHAIDFDGDGDIDILTDPLAINWYENDGNQNFTEHTIYSNTGTWSIYPIDIDNDNDIDVISASEYDDEIGIFYNDGNENFTEQFLPLNSFNAQALFPVDIDSDNDMDIIAVTGPSHSVIIFKNDGNQNFTEQIVTLDIFQPNAVGAGDINNDGHMDIVVNGGEIGWYENDGNLNFDKKIISSNTFDDPINLLVIDVDKDAAPDVITNSMHDDQVVVFYNNLETTPLNEEIIENHSLKIYPNPITNNAQLSITSNQKGLAKFALYNIIGNQVKKEQSKYLNEGENVIYKDDLALPHGIYFLKLEINNHSILKKIMVTRY